MYKKLNSQVKKKNNQLLNAIKKPHKKIYGEKTKNSLLNYILIAVTLKNPTPKNINKFYKHLKNFDKNTRSNFVAYFEHFYRKYKNSGTSFVKRIRNKLRNSFCNKIIKRKIAELNTQKRLDKIINIFQIKEKIKRKKVIKFKKRKKKFKIKKLITCYEKKKFEYLGLIKIKKEIEFTKIEKINNKQQTKIALIQQINFKFRTSKGFKWRKKYKYRSQQNIYNFKENNFKFNLLENAIEKYKNAKKSSNSFVINKKQNLSVFAKNKQQQFNLPSSNKTFEKNLKITKRQLQPNNLKQKIFTFNSKKQHKTEKAPSKFLDRNTAQKNIALENTKQQFNVPTSNKTFEKNLKITKRQPQLNNLEQKFFALNSKKQHKTEKAPGKFLDRNTAQKNIALENTKQQFNVPTSNKTFEKNLKITKRQPQLNNLEQKFFTFNSKEQHKTEKAPGKFLDRNTAQKNIALESTKHPLKTLELKKNNMPRKTQPKFEPKNKNK